MERVHLALSDIPSSLDAVRMGLHIATEALSSEPKAEGETGRTIATSLLAAKRTMTPDQIDVALAALSGLSAHPPTMEAGVPADVTAALAALKAEVPSMFGAVAANGSVATAMANSFLFSLSEIDKALRSVAPTPPSGEGDRMKELEAAAEAVCWFDWSDNDSDAVAAIARLRALLVRQP